jgi:hypothetical protein
MLLNDGTLQGRQLKVTEVVLNFLRSRGGWVGIDADNLTEVIQPQSLDGAPSLYSGEHSQLVMSDFALGGRILFRQISPLPFTLLSIVRVMTLGG